MQCKARQRSARQRSALHGMAKQRGKHLATGACRVVLTQGHCRAPQRKAKQRNAKHRKAKRQAFGFAGGFSRQRKAVNGKALQRTAKRRKAEQLTEPQRIAPQSNAASRLAIAGCPSGFPLKRREAQRIAPGSSATQSNAGTSFIEWCFRGVLPLKALIEREMQCSAPQGIAAHRTAPQSKAAYSLETVGSPICFRHLTRNTPGILLRKPQWQFVTQT